jgi:hypothetical protein
MRVDCGGADSQVDAFRRGIIDLVEFSYQHQFVQSALFGSCTPGSALQIFVLVNRPGWDLHTYVRVVEQQELGSVPRVAGDEAGHLMERWDHRLLKSISTYVRSPVMRSARPRMKLPTQLPGRLISGCPSKLA